MTVKILSGVPAAERPDTAEYRAEMPDEPAIVTQKPVVCAPAPQTKKNRLFSGELIRVKPRKERHGYFFSLFAGTAIGAFLLAAGWAIQTAGSPPLREFCEKAAELFRLR